jgi:ribose 5-phosphate isomerase B
MSMFNNALPVYIGSDHAGVEYKAYLKAQLEQLGIAVVDQGTYDGASVDYPDYAHAVATAVAGNQAGYGILICGSANGVAITANKHPNVRAALCWQNDIAILARQHNDANIICIPARFVAKELAWQMVLLFAGTAFEGGRHANRVAKINC